MPATDTGIDVCRPDCAVHLRVEPVARHATELLAAAHIPRACIGEQTVIHRPAIDDKMQRERISDLRSYVDAADDILLLEAERRGADIGRHDVIGVFQVQP